jgi:hypothetical protein
MQVTTRSAGWRLVQAVAVLGVAIATGCGEPPPPPPPPQAAAPPPPKPISLDPIPEVVVKAGTSGTARIEVNRAGHAGEATVTLAAPSDPGLTVTAEPIAADSRAGAIVVKAAETLGTSEAVNAVQVTVTLDGMTAQENLSIRVPQFEPPTFTPQQSAIVQPGRSVKTTVRIDRHGYEGSPIELSDAAPAVDGQPVVADAPREITCAPLTIPADADVATVEFAVAAEAADGPRTIVLSGSTMSRSFPAEFKLEVQARPYALAAPRVVTLAPGETQEVSLAATRPAYAGPIRVRLDDLPAGVTAEPVVIDAGAAAATLTLAAGGEAEPRVRSATLRSSGGPFAIDEPLVVRVRRPGEEQVVPAAVTAGGAEGRPRRPTPMSGRLSAAAKQALADLHGGTAESAAAVARGLGWLARGQQQDGSWTLKGMNGTAAPDAPSDPETPTNPTLATALAVLPFLGEGISHLRAPAEPAAFQAYPTAVQKGIVFLCVNQTRERGRDDGFLKGTTAAHSLAVIALAEDYELSREDRLKLHIRQAVKYLTGIQKEDGSWGADPDRPGDLVTTVWAVQALRAVQAAGLGTAPRQLKKAQQFIDGCGAGPTEAVRSRYRLTATEPVTPLATAAGLLGQIELGRKAADDPDLRAGGAFLLTTAPAARGVSPMPYLFLATEALRDIGGEDFDAWNHHAREHLVRRQRQTGDLDGSWDPDGADGGRMEATALALLTLQIPYRHLPLVRDAAKKPSAAEAAADAGEARAADEPR